MALLAKGEKTHAKEKFAEALELNPNHLWAAVKLSQIDQAI
ncbi:MAG: hypothetical protein ACYSU6_09165 [Planctomycetota bacterium]